MQRIVIIGTSGSGKTTLAGRLSGVLDLPHIELDALFWNANWTEAPRDVFRQRVQTALEGERWIVDGNYSKARDLIWPRADTLIWLDIPLHVCLGQALRRCIVRAARRQELWSGNRESFRKTFFSRDSLLLWILKSHGRHRREYRMLPALPDTRTSRYID